MEKIRLNNKNYAGNKRVKGTRPKIEFHEKYLTNDISYHAQKLINDRNHEIQRLGVLLEIVEKENIKLKEYVEVLKEEVKKWKK